ncbi:related to amino-terminal amidase [Rhynchosporium agropyri]|uniref:Related to amino-terminal amidase n=1 Tax=Rhynchosporium agropyri TaxID=914238 RepID=A0A1E1KWX1_9HELO|nr:related to amino-terminal amidase [Rhynchosporium agropyri]
MAFTGSNFRSLQHISPYLEPTAAGITSLWALTTALKHNCIVAAGYPEKVEAGEKRPANPAYHSSLIMVNAEGETIANYRKSFLDYTDETWVLEGEGFYAGDIKGLGNIAMGIGMDLNPYKLESPWSAWEFAHHVLHIQANLVILSMAWLTRADPRSFSRASGEPDMDALAYILGRLEPLIRAEAVGEIIVIFANRCGAEEEVVYAGTSTVLGINKGEVKVYGILGRGEKELLVVDTSKRPEAKLVSTLNSCATEAPETPPSPITTKKQPLRFPDWADDENSNPAGYYYDFSPVSPSDIRCPPFFFHPKPTPINEIYYDLPSPDCKITGFRTPSQDYSILYRPSSPKSRNLSRNKNRELMNSGGILRELDELDESFVEHYERKSASAVPDGLQATFSADSLGPRSEYCLPRSKSTVW